MDGRLKKELWNKGSSYLYFFMLYAYVVCQHAASSCVFDVYTHVPHCNDYEHMSQMLVILPHVLRRYVWPCLILYQTFHFYLLPKQALSYNIVRASV